jgi:hypothetical protein
MNKFFPIFLSIWLAIKIIKAETVRSIQQAILDRDLPEYKEFMRRVHMINQNFPTSTGGTTLESQKLMDSPIAPFVNFPSIHLCKDTPPEDGNYYGIIYCWVMFALYTLLVLSLIIYQLRSIFWLQKSIKKRNPREETQNGDRSDIKYSPFESKDEADIPRVSTV